MRLEEVPFLPLVQKLVDKHGLEVALKLVGEACDALMGRSERDFPDEFYAAFAELMEETE